MEETFGNWQKALCSALEIDSKPFHYVKTIGEGAFGVCSLYKNQTENLRYVVKRFCDSNQFQRQEMARHEIEFLRKCQSDNVVRLLGGLTETDYPYIVMEVCDGSLNNLIPESINVTAIKEVARDILMGLNYIHNMKIIHRDIKPSNILMTNGVAKICDFGTAIEMNDNKSREYVDPRKKYGTEYYQAPELVSEPPILNYGVDIWAFGVTLYKIMHNRLPFDNRNAANFFIRTNYGLLDFAEEFKNDVLWQSTNRFIRSIFVADYKARPTSQQLLINDFIQNTDFSSFDTEFAFKTQTKTQFKQIVMASTVERIQRADHDTFTKNDTQRNTACWLTASVDYANQIGLPFILSNGTYGIYFKNSHYAFWSPSHQQFQTKTGPAQLQNPLVLLVQFFRNELIYMQNKFRHFNASNEYDYITGYFRRGNTLIVLFHQNNVQISTIHPVSKLKIDILVESRYVHVFNGAEYKTYHISGVTKNLAELIELCVIQIF